MDNDNLATALLAQIQVSIALIASVRKISVEQRLGWPHLRQKQTTAAMRASLQTKSPTLKTEIIQL